MASGGHDSSDEEWQEEDPDFLTALSVYMDQLETEPWQQSQKIQQQQHQQHQEQQATHVVAGDSLDDHWTEDDPDFALALSMYLDEVESRSQTQGKDLSDADEISMFGCVVDQKLEDLDPNPDIWKLFRLFDERFFGGILQKNSVVLEWSPRMTSCAGICLWHPRTHLCQVRLSQPLLMLRSRSDLVETLIHEMIHAVLFVQRRDDNHESHGPLFHEHMYRINQVAGCDISVYHTFHAEVRHYQKHVWKCDGPCSSRPPYYGIVRRAMNRAPGPSDWWFSKHRSTCGGKFAKVSEPDIVNKKKGSPKPKNVPPKGTKDIRSYLPPSPKKSLPSASASTDTHQPNSSPKLTLPPNFVPFSGRGNVLGSSSPAAKCQTKSTPKPGSKKKSTIEVIDIE